MYSVDVSVLGVLLAAVGAFVVGFLWYGPIFGKKWIELMNFQPAEMEAAKQKGMGKTYAISFLGTLVMAYVVALFIEQSVITTVGGAIELAFWFWLGFVATTTLSEFLWASKKPWSLYLLNNGHNLVALIVMAIVLAQF